MIYKENFNHITSTFYNQGEPLVKSGNIDDNNGDGSTILYFDHDSQKFPEPDVISSEFV